MDTHFPNFWGDFLSNAASGQKQIDCLTQWVNQGFKGFEDFSTFFQKIYGLEQTGEGSPDYLRMWKKAQEGFEHSFKNYLDLFGVVPRDEHLALARRCEDLKEKVASRDETIKHLQLLLYEAKETYNLEVTKQFDNLLKKQNEQSQKLVDSFSKILKKDSSEAKETYHLEVAKQFDNLLKKQNEQYQKLMDSFSEMLKKDSSEVNVAQM